MTPIPHSSAALRVRFGPAQRREILAVQASAGEFNLSGDDSNKCSSCLQAGLQTTTEGSLASDRLELWQGDPRLAVHMPDSSSFGQSRPSLYRRSTPTQKVAKFNRTRLAAT